MDTRRPHRSQSHLRLHRAERAHQCSASRNGFTHQADAITDVPFSGKVVPEVNDEYLREVHAHAWRVIYHVRDRDMFVIAVIHKRQQITSADIRDLFYPQ